MPDKDICIIFFNFYVYGYLTAFVYACPLPDKAKRFP